MAYPKLVVCAKTPVHIVIESEETNEFNESVVLLDADFLCNYQDSASVKYSKDKQTPNITGTIYINGDILPGAAVISRGHVTIFGEKRDIVKGSKGRNLDGSVNYTKIEVS